ncbi:PREDICTED: F-box protein At2g21930-like [Camelina sativa]|uniref:F-box protein At2g21930-like n=1 Tax=Camelina sativa TaxID=90675 RepID=A0ABM0TUB7_CAMSA|nr:PREDICTED: F-box protein At2g21930-like [Camelina sativa]
MEAHEAKKEKNSDDLRTTGGSSHAISVPADVIPEIFKGLPVKSLARFVCVSKEYASFIRNRDFVKTYLMKSSDSPQSLIFTFEGKCSGKHFFFSSLQPQDRGESVSSSLAIYHMKCHFRPYKTFAPSVNGLICYGPPWRLMVYNPSTRRSITLPNIDSMRIDIYHFLGYDPISGDYKVLCMTKGDPVGMRFGLAQELRILTLGKDKSWRMIEDFPLHFLDFHESPDICIHGVLYYRALLNEDGKSEAFMSFDVRSEKFDLIKGPELLEYHLSFPKLTCYEGKLALVFSKLHIFIYSIQLWVLEDAATHEWSMQSYSFPIINGETSCNSFNPFFVVGKGELVLAPVFVERGPFDVLYYDPKKNRVRRVVIEGITGREEPLWNKDPYHRIISVIPGHANNLMFL